jgi:hypothetical protein
MLCTFAFTLGCASKSTTSTGSSSAADAAVRCSRLTTQAECDSTDSCAWDDETQKCKTGQKELCGGHLPTGSTPCSNFLHYCNLGSSCGEGDQTGVCEPRPDICDQLAEPVCGCDGHTYANPCYAARDGVSIRHSGACEGADDSGDGAE